MRVITVSWKTLHNFLNKQEKSHDTDLSNQTWQVSISSEGENLPFAVRQTNEVFPLSLTYTLIKTGNSTFLQPETLYVFVINSVETRKKVFNR